MQASILLEDGTFLSGRGHGSPGERVGEFVFNTAMTGYEEVVSDPSYRGQIVVFTTSHIGNTGITIEDLESREFAPEAFVCKEFSRIADNHRAAMPFETFLQQKGRFAVSGIDTRFLTRRLRNHGCMMGIISTVDHSKESLIAKLASATRIEGNSSLWRPSAVKQCGITQGGAGKLKVALLDFGIKKGIITQLEQLGCQCVQFAPPFCAADIEAIQPDGLFLSNGAGDPRVLLSDGELRRELLSLVQKYPTFGICLGHQILALLFSGRVDKLAFGHHAINHPVKVVRNFKGETENTRVFITSQNHNYCVDSESITDDFFVTHLHGNDGTVAGMHHHTLPVFSVQFHPESNPGPRDAALLFLEFKRKMEDFHANSY
jgi:carbamoyl-phosphate synthase small subunit